MRAKLVLAPPAHLDGQRGGDERVDLGLDGRAARAVDQACELAARGAGGVRRLELGEAGDRVREQPAHRGAEYVAARVQARVQVARRGVDALLDGVAGAEGRAAGEAPEVEDGAAAVGVVARRGHGEDRGGGGGGAGCVVRRGALHAADVGRLAAALRVEYRGLGGDDDEVIVVVDLLEERAVGFCERGEGLHAGYARDELPEEGVVLVCEVGGRLLESCGLSGYAFMPGWGNTRQNRLCHDCRHSTLPCSN